ncbi:MAG: peptidyl-prolyl cis-trans isomerase [Pseudomonadales bacterium]|nr:peptidyl-prolyl cis-trans isomerase [Pseudomonadales bacterium]
MASYLRFLLVLTICTAWALPSTADSNNQQTGNPIVTMETSMGVIKLELYPAVAPITVANFLDYVNKGFYNGTLFHRVIAYFMIQGGGLDQDLQLKPTGDPIISEADNGLRNDRGTIAMARTQDVNSAKAQFFINVENNTHLNYTRSSGGYTVFGRVIEGMDVIDKISNVETTNLEHSYDIPVEPVIITSVSAQPGTSTAHNH